MSNNQLGWGRSSQAIRALPTPRAGCPDLPGPRGCWATKPEQDLEREGRSLPLLTASPSFRPALPEAAAILQAAGAAFLPHQHRAGRLQNPRWKRDLCEQGALLQLALGSSGFITQKEAGIPRGSDFSKLGKHKHPLLVGAASGTKDARPGRCLSAAGGRAETRAGLETSGTETRLQPAPLSSLPSS